MAEFRLSPKAQGDLDAIFDYTVSRWGLDQALLYADRIEAACASLAEAPLQSQDCSLIRSGYRRRNVERHAIYFRQTSYGIAVIRIMHQRMDAPAIFEPDMHGLAAASPPFDFVVNHRVKGGTTEAAKRISNI